MTWKPDASHAMSDDGASCVRCGVVVREFAATIPCLVGPAGGALDGERTEPIRSTGTHTPPPWLVSDERADIDIVAFDASGDREIRVASVVRDHSPSRVEANARLIAAAPQLLAALKEALRVTGCDGDLCAYAWHEEARRAIRDAEGES